MIMIKRIKTFQACPICENELFTEYARQITRQENVKIFSDGKSDYLEADTNEFTDEFEVIEWVCQNCGVSLRLSKNGKLKAVPENQQKEVIIMSRVKDESDIPETVQVIASGYEWICPICEHLYEEIEWTEEVRCIACKVTFQAEPPEHAYGY